MNASDDPESFLKGFLARAKEREAKLASISDIDKDSINNSGEGIKDVSYPALSPLPEAKENSESEQLDESSLTEREENVSPSSELNYSSDLSLECSDTGVYRAEPIVCRSSPEHHTQQATTTHSLYSQQQTSPRKQINPTITSLQVSHQPEQFIPLQERQPDQKPTSSHSLPEISSTEQKEKEIQLKKERAEQTKIQLKKVVEISKHGSKEHIEAARLLQIAELEHLNYTNQLAMFKEGIRKQSESLGSIHLSNIRLKISPRLRNDLADDGVSHHFFCVATCGMEVKASEIIDTISIKRQDLKAYLQFRDVITFVDLPPNFMVKFEVYELVIGQHLPKLLSRLTPSKKTKITPESQFKRVGSLKLTLADRDVNYKNLTQWSKHEESKYIERECKFQMELRPEQLPTRAGMLHVRCLDNESRPDWSRLWVDLASGIRFWKCKQDALDGKKPNQELEFGDLCSETVQKLTPDDDFYRQNSFVLYSFQLITGGEKDNLFQRVLKDDSKYKIVKHQLAADSKEDRDAWCATLDRSMHCFREWHGKTRIYSTEEIKEIFSS